MTNRGETSSEQRAWSRKTELNLKHFTTLTPEHVNTLS